MKSIFQKHLFEKHILVGTDKADARGAFEVVFSLARLFGIRIVSGEQLANADMIGFASTQLGVNVPAPFYRGFPQSVRALSPDALLFDQLVSYVVTYGMGHFEEARHSILEQQFDRIAFREDVEQRDFRILTEEQAVERLAGDVEDLLSSSRPLSDDSFELVREYITEYAYRPEHCASKNTAVRLLLETRDSYYATFLSMSDVIKVVDEINYREYGNEDLHSLNLCNYDRKLITELIDRLCVAGRCDIEVCCEKKAIWNGLLHHIHYRAKDPMGELFVQIIRGKENFSAYSTFERELAARDIRAAVTALKSGKGSGALLRSLDYIVSRCDSEEELRFVIDQIDTTNGILLLQLLIRYATYHSDDRKRTFRFTRHDRLEVHTESDEEAAARTTLLSEALVEQLRAAILEKLEKVYHGRLNKVYVDEALKGIALPIQESTGASGFGVLPRGTRLHIREGKKIRGFTYWEKVDDIDLSVIGLRADGSQMEFSWRTMWGCQSDELVFSGDETSGYHGGAEYFDVDPELFRSFHPEVDYLIFCDNVFTSGVKFTQCLCTAGYMLRDAMDSGEIFEPKTVQSSFKVDCDSRFAYLFAIDMRTNDFVWLNIAPDSDASVAGSTRLDFLRDILEVAGVMDVTRFFGMLATELVDTPEAADIAVTDDPAVESTETCEVIRSWDTERIMALMNS